MFFEKKSKREEDETEPNCENVSWTKVSKIFFVTVRVINIFHLVIELIKLVLKINRPGLVSKNKSVIS